MFTNEIFTKVIISGNLIEVTKYEKPILIKTGKRGGRRFNYEAPSDEEIENKKVSISRAMTMFKRLYACNFVDSSTFITLTFVPQKMLDTHDPKACKNELDKFMKRMRRKFGLFRYLGVTEFQRNGAVHYHLVTDIPYIQSDVLAKLWTAGYSKAEVVVNDPKSITKLASYMSKDINDSRLRHSHTYLRSKNLSIPLSYKGIAAEREMLEYDLSDETPVTVHSFDTKYFGRVSYEEYYLPGKMSHV